VGRSHPRADVRRGRVASRRPRIVDWWAWPYVSAGYWRQHGSRLLVRGTPSGCSSGLCTIADLTRGQRRLEGTLPGRWLAVDGSETGDLIYGVNEIGEPQRAPRSRPGAEPLVL
jgi:hypothetical protein